MELIDEIENGFKFGIGDGDEDISLTFLPLFQNFEQFVKIPTTNETYLFGPNTCIQLPSIDRATVRKGSKACGILVKINLPKEYEIVKGSPYVDRIDDCFFMSLDKETIEVLYKRVKKLMEETE